jgi:quercetin dioxygenase-like cupin family protein
MHNKLREMELMNVSHYTNIEPQDAGPGTSKLTVRWLITTEMGAKNFAMRLFEMGVGGHTPHHSHDWEHEIYILEGEGVALGGTQEMPFKTGDVIYIPPNEVHQLKNTGKATCRIICLIPYTEKQSC